MTHHNIATLTVEDGVAVILVDNPPVNTINAAVRSALMAAVLEIQSVPGLQAVVLACAGSTFFSGADLAEFAGPPQEEAYRSLFGRIEQLPVPVVAAMHGTVMGGGLEIALACHHRVAAPGSRFALPEVTLGIIPGAGGTQRMPRLIGVEKTLEFIIDARPVDTTTALEWGFLDAVIEGDLRAGAIAYARALVEAGKGPRRTSERSVDPATCSDAVIERLTARAIEKYPNRTAPLRAIDAVRAALRMPLQQGLEYETKLVNEAKRSVESRGAVHAFFAEREDEPTRDLRRSLSDL